MYRTTKMHLVLVIAAGLLNAPALVKGEGFVLYPNMSHARVGHSATLLPNGEVLVVGGISDASDGKSAAIFSATHYWSETNPAKEARRNHTASSIPHGNVLISGGSNPTTLTCSATAEIFSVSTTTFSFTTSMNEPRQFHTATPILGGKILVVGGVGDDSVAKASAEIYDPVMATWSYTGSLNTARARHSATRLNNGQVLVTGGDAGDGVTFYSSAELYDPASGTWSYTENRGFQGPSSAASLLTGDVLVANGTDAVVYRAGPERFLRVGTPYPNFGSERLTLLYDGRVLMTGGKNSNGTISNWWQLYDPTSRAWVSFPSNPMNGAHSGHTSTRLRDGTVLVCGGLGSDGQPGAVTDVFFPY